MKQIQVTLRTLSPVVLSAMSNATVMTASHTYFSGSILRGIFAKRYIEQNHLGNEAQTDAQFLQLFFAQLRFTPAYPVTMTGKCSFVAPFSLQRSKDGKQLLDLLHDESKPGFKSMKGFVAAEGDTLMPVAVRKTINLHMSRNDQKNKDGAERLAGRSLAGGIYNYEAIEAGQTFSAFIYGEDADLQNLVNALQAREWQCYVGRSKYTQYGHCALLLGEITEVPKTDFDMQDNTVCLRLATPLLLNGNNILSAEQGLSFVAESMNERTSGVFSICAEPQKLFAKAEPIENFVGIWGMKRPRMQALSAGTVFLLRKNSAWTEADKEALQYLLYAGVGSRTEEGFGQLRVWRRAPWTLAKAAESETLALKQICSPEVQKRATAILLSHLTQQAQIWAAEDVQTTKKFFTDNSAHFFSRLTALLGTKIIKAQEHLQYGIEAELGNPSTPFAKGLQNVMVCERPLKWYLIKARLTEMPYNQRNWQALSAELHLSDIFQAMNVMDGLAKLQASEALFYTYWHWFFRYARKAAGATKGAEAE